MEQDTKPLELQGMSEQEKIRFIQRKLSLIDPDDVSSRSHELSSVRLLHPELLWPVERQTPIPDSGNMVQLTPELSSGRRQKRGLLVEGTIRGIPFHAVFGLGAVGITVGGDIIIDCALVEKPRSTGQILLPNTFVEK